MSNQNKKQNDVDVDILITCVKLLDKPIRETRLARDGCRAIRSVAGQSAASRSSILYKTCYLSSNFTIRIRDHSSKKSQKSRRESRDENDARIVLEHRDRSKSQEFVHN